MTYRRAALFVSELAQAGWPISRNIARSSRLFEEYYSDARGPGLNMTK